MIQIAMTRAQFAAKAAQLELEQGVQLTGDSGTLSKDGHEASYVFTGTSLQVVSHDGNFIARKLVEARIRNWLEG